MSSTSSDWTARQPHARPPGTQEQTHRQSRPDITQSLTPNENAFVNDAHALPIYAASDQDLFKVGYLICKEVRGGVPQDFIVEPNIVHYYQGAQRVSVDLERPC
jgi:hypothetical protein